MGIDLYYCHLNNGDAWRAYGGFGSGRKWPILFAGIVLGDTSMQNPIETTGACCCLTGTVNKFGEDGHTYYGLPTVEYPDGQPLWGQDAFFDYVDWWVIYETQTDVHTYGNDFIEDMWKACR